jgi:hypothetical protein
MATSSGCSRTHEGGRTVTAPDIEARQDLTHGRRLSISVMEAMPVDRADRARRPRFRERHPTLLRGILQLIAIAALIYLIAHRFLH